MAGAWLLWALTWTTLHWSHCNEQHANIKCPVFHLHAHYCPHPRHQHTKAESNRHTHTTHTHTQLENQAYRVDGYHACVDEIGCALPRRVELTSPTGGVDLPDGWS
jgi:hypothetical protein